MPRAVRCCSFAVDRIGMGAAPLMASVPLLSVLYC